MQAEVLPVGAKYAYISIPTKEGDVWRVTVYMFNGSVGFISPHPSEACVSAYAFCDDNDLEVLEDSKLG